MAVLWDFLLHIHHIPKLQPLLKLLYPFEINWWIINCIVLFLPSVCSSWSFLDTEFYEPYYKWEWTLCSPAGLAGKLLGWKYQPPQGVCFCVCGRWVQVGVGVVWCQCSQLSVAQNPAELQATDDRRCTLRSVCVELLHTSNACNK